MKVLQLLPELNEGGVERGTAELSREFVKQGLTSIVISKGGKLVEQIEKEGGQHICLDVCSKNPFTLPYRIFKLRQQLRALAPDVVHARSRIPAWMTYFANRALGIPFVTTVHGLNSVSRYSEIMTKGDRVITVSEVVRDYVLKHYSVAEGKIRVIQRGVDTQFFNPEHVDSHFIEQFKAQYDLNNKFIVSSVGRITWLKDFETFIKAIAIAKEKIPNITALIVGGIREDKQDYFNSLKDLARKHGVEQQIIFTGSQSKVAEVYALSDLTVNASLKMGNIGRTVVESLAMNTPTIATTYEGLTNLVEDGVNGYLIKTQDPDDLANKIVAVSQGRFKQIRETLNPDYTLDTMVRQTLAVYREVANKE